MDKASTATGTKPLNKGQRTATRILDVAEVLFAQQGYGATSLRDIAARADIQQPGLYKHFAGKDDLYRRVYERALAPVTALMDDILAGPDEHFDHLTDRMTDLLALHPNIARLLARAAMASDDEPDEVAAEWLSRLVGYGRQLTAKAGVVADDRLLAVQIVATFNMLFGFFWASPLVASLSGRAATEPDMLMLQKAVARAMIGGFGARAEPLIDAGISE
jgi:AcrR family transcriptional regulator